MMWQSFAVIGRDGGDLALKKEKRKKETAVKHKGSRVALLQRGLNGRP